MKNINRFSLVLFCIVVLTINIAAYLANLPELDKTNNTRSAYSKAIYNAAQA